MLRIYQFEPEEHRAIVRDLFWDYLHWANQELNERFGIDLDIESMLDGDMRELDKFRPPHGQLLLAEQDGEIAGLACLQKSKPGIGELKRMYVKPEYRRRGIGKSLVERLLEEARQFGYLSVRLDSARFMLAAHTMYRSLGFQDIEPYRESEIPAEFHSNWVFMEVALEAKS